MKLLAALCLFPCFAAAVPITGVSLSFDGLANGEQVLNYYTGGLAGSGSGPGPSFGVAFTSGLAADSTVIAFGPSAVVTAPSVTMTLDGPWLSLISFYFTGNGSVSFYSGPNATGTLLRPFTLVYPPFFPFSAQPGPFQSVVFTPATGNTMRLDSISFGSAVVPEPSIAILVLTGITLLAGFRRFSH